MLIMIGICATSAYPGRSLSENEDTENCLIREDRIWEYYKFKSRNYEDISFSLSRYKFEGTEEKYGKTYHRWCATDRDYWGAPIGQLPNGEWDWGVQTERIDTCVALLREEDKIVYMLIEEDDVYDYHQDSKSFVKQAKEEGKEVILYDFNLNAGDKGKSFIKNFCWENYEPWYSFEESVAFDIDVSHSQSLDEYSWHPKLIEAKNIVLVDYLNNIGARYGFDDYAEGVSEYIETRIVYIEGIGNIVWGDLISFGNTERYWAKELACYANNDIYLNNFYDIEGNVLYPGENVTAPRSGVESAKVTIPKLSINGNSVLATLQGADLRITVYSPDGLMIASEKNLDTVEICGLPSGIYLVEVKTPGHTLKKKIIIR